MRASVGAADAASAWFIIIAMALCNTNAGVGSGSLVGFIGILVDVSIGINIDWVSGLSRKK